MNTIISPIDIPVQLIKFFFLNENPLADWLIKFTPPTKLYEHKQKIQIPVKKKKNKTKRNTVEERENINKYSEPTKHLREYATHSLEWRNFIFFKKDF